MTHGVQTAEYNDPTLSFINSVNGEGTMGHTNDTPNAYMELDFGVGGQRMNRVRVRHRYCEIRRSNGMTLDVKGPTGNMIFSYTFSGITLSSPGTDTFNMSGQKV